MSLSLNQLKEKGLAPEWYTESSLKTVENGYLIGDETPYDMYSRVAVAAASRLNKPELATKFFNIIWKGWLGLATPVAANMGAERGLPISCYGGTVEDTIPGIFEALREMACMGAKGGGTSLDLRLIRSKGASISDGGKSKGVVPWSKIINEVIYRITQGNCYVEGTQILTDNGWKEFKDLLPTDLVAQVTDDKEVEFVKPLDYIEQDYDDDVVCFSNTTRSIDLVVTKNHNMVIEKRKRISNVRNSEGKFANNQKTFTGVLERVEADLLSFHRDNIHYITFPIKGGEKEHLTSLEQFLIAYQADGSTKPSGDSTGAITGEVIHVFHFQKERKVERLTQIISKLGWRYKTTNQPSGNTEIHVWIPLGTELSKEFSWLDLGKVSQEWCAEFVEELQYWDGTLHRDDVNIKYYNTNKVAVERAQAVASLAGYKTSYREMERDESRQTLYNLYIDITENKVIGQTIQKTYKPYKGKVYCVEVPSNKILVRYQGVVSVCGNTRRGANVLYYPIDYPDYLDFLKIRKPNTDPEYHCPHIHQGAVITDDFMERVLSKDPNARALWIETINSRWQTGEPFLFFKDAVNRDNPPWYTDKGFEVSTSNLCTEITLFSDIEHSFVCCLSSLNIAKYQEWKDTDTVYLATWFLDAVMEEFIQKAKHYAGFERAVRFAEKSRALGLGVLGYHTYLQEQGIPFEDSQVESIDQEIFGLIKREAERASRDLATEYGEPEWCKGYGVRNTHTITIAPTVSNSTILGGVSAGIEPITDGIFVKDSAKGYLITYNESLRKLLKSKDKDKPDVWDEIIRNSGSVSGLSFLDEHERRVFKTAREIDMLWLVELAAKRQKILIHQQAASVNLFFNKDEDAGFINKVHLAAYRNGLKTLYYNRSEATSKGDDAARKIYIDTKIETSNTEGCIPCGG